MAGNSSSMSFRLFGEDVTASRAIRGVGREADTTAEKLRDIGSKGLSPLMTAAAALGPALLPVLAGATLAAGALGVATVASGAALGVFAAVSKTAYANIGAASKTLTTAHTALAAADAKVTAAQYALSQAHTKTGLVAAHHRLALAMDQQSKAAAQLATAQSHLTGPLGEAAAAQGRTTAAWKKFVDLNSPAVYAVFTQGFNLITTAIPKLEPLFKVAAGAARYFLTALQQFASEGGLDRLVKFLAAQAEPALYTFIAVSANVARGLGGLGRAFGTVSGEILDHMQKLSVRFGDFGQNLSSGGGFARFVAYAKANGPAVGAALASIAVSLARITVAVSPLAPLSLAVAKGLSGIVNATPLPVLTGMVGGFIALNIALKAVALATSIATAAQVAFDVAMDANPIGLAIVSTAALVAAIVWVATKTTWFQTIWKVTWGAVLVAARAVAGFFSAWPGFFSRIWDDIAGFFVSAAGRIVGAYQAVTGWFAKWPAFFSGVWRSVTGFFAAAAARIVAGFGVVVAWFAALPRRLLAGLVALPGLMWRLFTEALDRAAYAFGYGVGTIIRLAITVVPKVLAAIRALPGQLWALIVGAWDRARDATEAGAAAVVAFFASLPGRAGRAVSRLWSAMVGAFRTAYAEANRAATALVNAVTSFLSSLPGRAGRAVARLWSALSGAFRTAASSAVHGAQDLINGVIRWLAQLPGRAGSALASLPGRIRGVFAGAAGWLISAGEDIIRGLISGIGHMAGAAAQAAKNAVSSALQGAKNALGIGSPSKVFRDEVGKWIPPGIAAGITSASPDLVRTMAATMRGVTAAAQVPVTGGVSLTHLRPGTAAAGRAAAPAPGTAGGGELLQPIVLKMGEDVVWRGLLTLKRRNGGRALGLA